MGRRSTNSDKCSKLPPLNSNIYASNCVALRYGVVIRAATRKQTKIGQKYFKEKGSKRIRLEGQKYPKYNKINSNSKHFRGKIAAKRHPLPPFSFGPGGGGSRKLVTPLGVLRKVYFLKIHLLVIRLYDRKQNKIEHLMPSTCIEKSSISI